MNLADLAAEIAKCPGNGYDPLEKPLAWCPLTRQPAEEDFPDHPLLSSDR